MTLAIIGLGYVGLPLAVEFGKQRPVLGFYGTGIPAQCFSQQVEINRTLITISRAHKAHGTARLLVPVGSKVNPLHIDDEIARIQTLPVDEQAVRNELLD